MAKKNKNYMPQSTAGLMRFDEDDSAFRLKPEHVVAISGVVGIGLLMIHLLG